MKKLKKTVLKKFINLEKAAKKIAKSWDKNTLPISVVEEMINIIRYKTDLKEMQEFKTAYNNTLNALVKTLKQKAKSMNSKEIPVEYLSNAIKVIKNTFLKTVNG